MGFDRAANAFNGLLNNKIAEASSKLHPTAKTFFDRMLGSAFPGYGLPDNPNTEFTEKDINERIRKLIENANTMAQATPFIEEDKVLAHSTDWRARIRPKAGGAKQFYQKNNDSDYLLRPIQETGGLVLQYTPTLMLQGQTNYNQAHYQGMNYQVNTFNNSTPPMLPISSDWTANDIYEARYLLAVFTFLRICGKGFYGDSAVANGTAGMPPPVLLFDYLGDHMFTKVPVVVTSYNIALAEEVDYVPVKVNDTVSYVPTRCNIMINMEVTYTPQKLRRRFNIEEITSGARYKDGFI